MDEFRQWINLVEAGMGWKYQAGYQGNAVKDAYETEFLGKSLEQAEEYIEKTYKFRKKYQVTGARLRFDPELDKKTGDVNLVLPDKVFNHMQGMNSLVDYLKLKPNMYMSGSRQLSMSIGYSWYTMENQQIGMLYYQDRAMNNDEIIIAANDKTALENFRSTLIDFGIIPSSDDRARKRKENAEKRMAAIEKKGIKVGTRITSDNIDNGELLWTGIVSKITPGGAIKIVVDKTGEGYDYFKIGDAVTMKPGSISKAMISNGPT